jgi:hypothetical protein
MDSIDQLAYTVALTINLPAIKRRYNLLRLRKLPFECFDIEQSFNSEQSHIANRVDEVVQSKPREQSYVSHDGCRIERDSPRR